MTSFQYKLKLALANRTKPAAHQIIRTPVPLRTNPEQVLAMFKTMKLYMSERE